MALPCLGPLEGGAVLAVVVQPRASRTEIVGLQGEELKIRLTSPPVEGAANRLCCDYLAKLCGVARSQVTLLSGDRSRHKRLRIAGVTVDELERVLRGQL